MWHHTPTQLWPWATGTPVLTAVPAAPVPPDATILACLPRTDSPESRTARRRDPSHSTKHKAQRAVLLHKGGCTEHTQFAYRSPSPGSEVPRPVPSQIPTWSPLRSIFNIFVHEGPKTSSTSQVGTRAMLYYRRMETTSAGLLSSVCVSAEDSLMSRP
ncbi:hypothetical protein SODALDRAFT_330780 [Sodiomyces alkalinus F11]|uniref:Uncharacterized protein n=1 Tax=Sodiomyces alkalinus (strain CBS 110278 / VKM F-3762 / F11) TaxID=1314773 RepID=A0A3N2Q2V1_SODAK|nr:hypothetical protein SODALDRAFT_330780 [Sodiomyces alkalinus F11]ROT41062.1 hypothetical protein SODALDRAFT_330780 [Sodiomyces alkalinus F11]